MERLAFPILAIALLACSPETEGGEPAPGDVICSRAAAARLGAPGELCFRVDDSGNAVFQGDILLGRAAELGDPVGTVAEAKSPLISVSAESGVQLWPNGTVHYQLSSAFTPDQKQSIEQTIAYFNALHSQTSVHWVQRTTQPDYVFMEPKIMGAFAGQSAIGKAGGAQLFYLNFANIDARFSQRHGVILHEMGHAMGLLHEHTREDRDAYVSIHTQNIHPDYVGNFDKLVGPDFDDVGVYDFASVMHYPMYNGSIQWGVLPTITKIGGGSFVTGSESGVMSAGDVAGLGYLYRPLEAASLPFSDAFNRPDGIVLGPSWENQTGKIDLVSNGAENAALTYASVETVAGVSAPAAAVEADLALSPSADFSSAYVVARYGGAGDANHYYAGFIKQSASTPARLTLRKRIGEAHTELAGVDLPGVTSGRVRLEASGVGLGVFRNGALVWSVADASFTSGNVGVKLAGPARVDNFSAAALPNPHVAHWRFDETTGKTASNAIGGGHTGGLSAAGVVFVPGVRGNALHFGGTGAVTVPNHSALNPGTSDFTVAGFIGSNKTARQYVLSKRSICNHGSFWNLVINHVPGKLSIEVDGSSAGANYLFLNGTKTVNDYKWHHFAIVRQGSSLKLYVDGVLDASATTPSPTNLSNTASLRMGTNVCYGNFVGWLDDVRYYAAALSAAEVSALRQP
jgi:astacin